MCNANFEVRSFRGCTTLWTIVLLVMAGCSSQMQLMRTPNIYTQPDVKPFAEVPPALQNDHVDVLYLTDRAPDNAPTEPLKYGYHRSRSVAFGVAQVQI